MKEVKYSIYRPAGNDTALVYGVYYSKKEKKIINDEIMKKHSNVEQVGFVSLDKNPELQMAGGEFCGNATRSTAFMYLNGKKGDLEIIINSNNIINAGVYDNKKAWCEIPLLNNTDNIIKKDDGIFIVKMEGIVIVVIELEQAKKYLRNRIELKKIGMEFIYKYNLENNDAVGVMFCEKANSKIKINPIVWVKSINTLFYETACGSGTTAVCMIEAINSKSNQQIDVIQPSGLIITSKVDFCNGKIEKAIIFGDVITDNKIYSIEI